MQVQLNRTKDKYVIAETGSMVPLKMGSTGSYQHAKRMNLALGPIIASPVTAQVATGDVALDLS